MQRSSFNKRHDSTATTPDEPTSNSHPLGVDVVALSKRLPHHQFGPMLEVLDFGEQCQKSGDKVGLAAAKEALEKLADKFGLEQVDGEIRKMFGSAGVRLNRNGAGDMLAHRAGVVPRARAGGRP